MDAVPARFNMARYCIGDQARWRPDKVALTVAHAVGHQSMTFAELDRAVRQAAAGMRTAGIRQGERVLLRLGNTALTPIAFFGAMAAGIVALPASSQLTDEEVDFLRRDAGATVITPDVAQAWLTLAPQAGYRDTAPDDPAFMVYTSGTTAQPKGVLHAHRSAWGRRPMYDGWYGLRSDDVMLHAGALNWTYTLGVGLTDPWAKGATAVIYDGAPDRTVWPRLVERFGATLFAAVPGVYRQLLESDATTGHDLTTLRHGLVAGEALSPRLWKQWRERTGKELYEALGMSEISTFISSGPLVPTLPGSPGKPQADRLVAILPADPRDGCEPLPSGEAGLLAVHRSDPGLMLGYWNKLDENPFRGEWFVTADLAHVDDAGYIHHHGRVDDVMNASGYRVSPVEVEHCLSRHPRVAEVAVTEMKVGDQRHIIAAFVVPQPDACGAASTADDILGFARQHLAAYKVPREVRFVDRLPRTPNGKIQRQQLPR